MALVIGIMLTAEARWAHAGDGDGKPWLPLVGEDDTPAGLYDTHSLSMIRVGEQGWRINRGKYRSSISRHDFFLTVGRQDLALHESRSAAMSSIMAWGGAGLVVGGLWWAYAAISPGGFDPSPGLGFGVACIGVVSLYSSSWVTGPSLGQDEAETMALRYNDQLKEHIERETGMEQRKPLHVRLRGLVPWAEGRAGTFGVLALATF